MALRTRKSRVAPPPDLCPLSTCMALLDRAWAANVIWHLSAGPRRFGELRKDIPRISARVLSARLRGLQAHGVITRHVVASAPPSVEYALTELGLELVPALQAIVDVGLKLKQRASKEPASARRRIV